MAPLALREIPLGDRRGRRPDAVRRGRRMGARARRAVRRGYRRCDVSLLLGANDAIVRSAEDVGGERSTTWRIYELAP